MRRLLALTAVVSMAAVGACSSDDATLTTDEFLEQGNAICKEVNETLDKEGADVFADPNPSADDIQAFVDDTFEPNIQGALDDIEALNGPDDLQDPVDQMLADGQTALDELTQLAADDPEAVFASEEDPFAEFSAQATEIGLDTCADEGGSEAGGSEDVAAGIVADPSNPYCDIEAQIDAIFEAAYAGVSPDASAEEQLAAGEEAAKEIIASGLIDEARSLAPDEIAGDIDALIGGVQDLAAGDSEALASPEVGDAGTRVSTLCGTLDE